MIPPQPSFGIDPARDEPPSADIPIAPGQFLLTVRQVARLLGMTPKAIYHRAERGQLPGKFYVGRSLRFRRADLLRFIGEGRGLSPTRSR
jgi:excisionase family DNA binding protein